MNIICGMDVASTSAQVCVLGEGNAIIAEASLAADRAGENRLLQMVPPEAAVYLESTGRYHLPWARLLAAADRRPYVVNALLAKRLLSAGNAMRQRKTDSIDARELALMGRRDGPDLERFRYQEDPGRDALRGLNRTRFFQRRQLNQFTQNANHLLGMMLPEGPWLNLNAVPSLAALFLETNSLEELQRKRMVSLERMVPGKGAQLQALLRGPLSAGALFDLLLPGLQAQLRVIALLREQQKVLLRQITELAAKVNRTEEIELIRSIPGFGAKTATALLGFLPADLRQWGPKQKVARRLQAYFGFDPRLRQSGKWRGKVRMTKRGDPLPRTALYQSAVCAIFHDEHARAVFKRKQAEGKPHRVSVSHVMRIQLRRLVAVLYDRKPFIVRTPDPLNNALPSL